ncbi:phospholipase [Rhodovulum sulfidophilum]|uniref:phospholipase D family protein n=1 Tax=Rhodovulum sulfidophilum TaxID=35806 RepID=UPI0019272199|nr:phospholipase D-like domain-containing protein [Rhodovulum sulfidophilum]MBL3587255.1 phospholipase [Rhodovulum sulfidophilum]
MHGFTENSAALAAATGPVEELELLLTAAEAYPALERAFLGARQTISASFRIFDLATRLRSPEARAIGEDWFDLLVHTLERGVSVRLVLTDFDPIGAADLHRLSWNARRRLIAAREVARGGRLEVLSALHSAQAGIGARLALWPGAHAKLRSVLDDLNARSEPDRRRFLEEAPGIARITRERPDGRIVAVPGLPDLTPATHHQKMAVFDGRQLYVGGLDLNERRYDSPRHCRAPERTWHDVHAMVRGPVVTAAAQHLDGFLDIVAGWRPPGPAAPGFLRTLSRPARRAPFRFSPRPLVTEIERAHLSRIGAAERLIYLETQFFRHLPLARAMARRAEARPDLRAILVLPAAPEDVAFENSSGLDVRYGEHLQSRCLSLLYDAFGPDRVLVLSPVQPRQLAVEGRAELEDAPIIYVHSKVSIFDGDAAILSSANLNGRSMRWDTEAGLELTAPSHVDLIRRRVMGHWLPREGDGAVDPAALDPRTAFEAWRVLADLNSRRSPERREGFLVHYDSDPARKLGLPVPGVPPEIV